MPGGDGLPFRCDSSDVRDPSSLPLHPLPCRASFNGDCREPVASDVSVAVITEVFGVTGLYSFICNRANPILGRALADVTPHRKAILGGLRQV